MSVASILPPHLRERTRRAGGPVRPLNEGGRFVLYWMRTAARGHENPALDVALTLANARGVPVLVYQALSERYPYASDRHHTFALEGARDVAQELAARGIAHVFHLERRSHDARPHLKTLAARAVAVVTEDFPLAPLSTWAERLAEDALVALVDTACVVPMKLVGRAYDRAFAYEKATKALRRERVSRPWVDVEPEHQAFGEELPFEPIRLDTADIAALVASCAIDHGVGPVRDTPGGSVAGYARFEVFAKLPIQAYARDRNQPLSNGVSRMSAYLHFGHVSPLRIARRAAELHADKYLDELLTWREVAYSFAAHRPDIDSVDALPSWARETLAAHERDPRDRLFSWEALARSRTGDALWDAAQSQLRVRGEIHNNVRMTWGKALVGWTPTAADALRTLVDLNHRYALDGRDPASFGGILWCLGQFDRPFPPEQPILGTVRPRPTAFHARRLDVDAYARTLTRALRPRRVAVIGGGLSGLICARTLLDHGHTVVVFDKGRRVGGRAASRTRELYAFDHGAQVFTARSEWLRRHVASWEADGIVARWRPRGYREHETLWVGTPTMGALAAHLARDLEVRTERRIESVERASAWRVDGEPFDALVVAVPTENARPLVGAWVPKGAFATFDPCWAVMVALRGGPDADVIEGEPLVWAARETSKPGRAREDGLDTWTLHLSNAWTRAHLEDEPETVRDAALAMFTAAHAPSASVVHAEAHRWRYAFAARRGEADIFFDRERSLVVCGDAIAGSGVEEALASGVAAAGRILAYDAPAHADVDHAVLPENR